MEKWKMFIDFILVAGMSFLGLTILFLIKSKGRFFQKVLIVFFANAICFLLYYYAYLHKSHILGAIAVLLGNGVGFLLGPLLYFQVKSLILPTSKFIRSLYFHLLPFLVIWISVSLPLSICMATRNFSGIGKVYLFLEPYLNIVENLFFLTYIFFSFRLLKQIKKLSEENYSSIEKNNLSWYKHLLIGFVVIVMLDTFCTGYELFYPIIPWNIGTLIAFCLVILYVYLGYKGMFQSQLLLPDFLLNGLPSDSVLHSDFKPVKGHLEHYPADEIEELKDKLSELLKTKKLYLNDSLNLAELSEEMNISNKKLSELLNKHLNTSFYNLINDYRVNEVIKRMESSNSDKYTLLAIAYESGFQSKASFNRIFKQKTGISPSRFKEEIKAKYVENEIL